MPVKEAIDMRTLLNHWWVYPTASVVTAGVLAALLTLGKRNDDARHRAMRRHEAWRSR